MSENVTNTRENIYDARGLDKVFKFTLRQTFKNKSYLVTFIMFIIIMAMLKPINYFSAKSGQSSFSSSGTEALKKLESSNIYVVNDTAVDFSMGDIDPTVFGHEGQEGVDGSQIVMFTDASKDGVLDGLCVNESAVIIEKTDKNYMVKVVLSADTTIQLTEADAIADYFTGVFATARYKSAGLTDDKLAALQKGIYIGRTETQASFEASASSDIPSLTFMMLMLTFSVISFMSTSMSTSYIIASVTEEKQNKLVESILVTVRPMALLLGKILGMMAYVVLMLVSGILAAQLTDLVMFNVIGLEKLPGGGGGIDLSVFTRFGVPGAIFMVISVVLGYLTFSVLSGMLGGACSKMEDIQSATSTVMMIAMVGYMGAILVGGMDMQVLNIVSALVPPLSIFSLPVIFFCGRINIAIFILGYVIQLVVLLVLVRLMAKAYRVLILADASTPKLKTIFKAAKG